MAPKNLRGSWIHFLPAWALCRPCGMFPAGFPVLCLLPPGFPDRSAALGFAVSPLGAASLRSSLLLCSLLRPCHAPGQRFFPSRGSVGGILTLQSPQPRRGGGPATAPRPPHAPVASPLLEVPASSLGHLFLTRALLDLFFLLTCLQKLDTVLKIQNFLLLGVTAEDFK